MFSNFSLLVPFLLLGFYLINNRNHPEKRHHACPRRIRDIHEARRILKHSSLLSRAVPNKRLVTAFGINNAFTTTDSVHHKSFVTQAKKLINTKEEEWMKLSLTACDIVELSLSPLYDDSNAQPLALVKSVQSLVFRIVLAKFFPKSQSPTEDDVVFATSKINSLWIASKACSSEDSIQLLHDNIALLGRLKSFIQPQKTGKYPEQDTSENNPLNWILPAYETLWRVVLHCFLEVRFRACPSDTKVFKQSFMSFLNQPFQRNFEAALSPSSIPFHHIVSEALRLYPPTRRVNRQLSNEAVAIDIEHLHRDPGSWGDDVLEFKPNRWEEKNFEKKAYMPFGTGSFECPAKNSFGPMMIGILIGALVGSVDEGFELSMDGLRGDVLGSGPLEGGREAYGGLELVRVRVEE